MINKTLLIEFYVSFNAHDWSVYFDVILSETKLNFATVCFILLGSVTNVSHVVVNQNIAAAAVEAQSFFKIRPKFVRNDVLRRNSSRNFHFDQAVTDGNFYQTSKFPKKSDLAVGTKSYYGREPWGSDRISRVVTTC
ncbi:uncharacterized protein LOC120428853 [Culex pipiens pallens]|uniref:uncharacterized protein LOC120428853 n=1 Tax=Culex pipiens pallens TaxID=42434 RepID=UPI001952F834|nr:uncharacterized protein LOC120428853 [Culex pipiens pallens]